MTIVERPRRKKASGIEMHQEVIDLDRDLRVTAYHVNFSKVALDDDDEAAALVDQLVKLAKRVGAVLPVNMTITAAIARALGRNNPSNRALALQRVEHYRDVMAGEAWENNGQGLIVGTNGEMLTGQHRIRALIEADKTHPGASFEAVVTFGVPFERRLTLDIGKSRSAPDLCAMVGVPNASRASTVARYIWCYLAYASLKKSPGQRFPDQIEIKDTALNHPEIADALVFAAGAPFPRRPALAAVHFILMRAADTIEDIKQQNAIKAEMIGFLDGVARGVGLAETDFTYQVRNRFLGPKRVPSYWATAELLVRAWNATRTGKGLAAVFAKGGKLPEVELEKST
jgi:hypothetical protein